MTKQERAAELKLLSGTKVENCMKCGKCSGRCPAFKEMDIKPHQFVSKLAQGKVDELLNSKSIWSCLACMACVERCPRGVAPAAMIGEILRILDGPFGIADVTIENIMCGMDNHTTEQNVAAIAAITAEDVRELANRYLERDKIVEVVVG